MNLQYTKFFKEMKSGLCNEIRCSRWLQGMVPDGLQGFQTNKKKIHDIQLQVSSDNLVRLSVDYVLCLRSWTVPPIVMYSFILNSSMTMHKLKLDQYEGLCCCESKDAVDIRRLTACIGF